MKEPDAGEADPRLARALTAATGSDGRAELLAALVDARVFAAITATATAQEPAERTGLPAGSAADMAVVLLEGAAGDRALPIFADLAGLRRWRLDARPVPLTGAQACAAALDEGADTVLLDPAGVSLALDLSEVQALAGGWVPVAGSSLAARRAQTQLTALAVPAQDLLVAALQRALKAEHLRSARLLQGPDGLVLGIALRRRADPAALAALAARVVARLGPDLPAEGLDLVQVELDGPGQELIARRWLRRGR